MWHELSPVWQTAFSEAWFAFQKGSVPIGAVITDEQGTILVKGRNHIGDNTAEPPQICDTNLAHAEMNTLLQLKPQRSQCTNYVLYTTCEPCPMCFSSIYMSGIRTIHYAARDPYAGSTNLLGTTPYLNRKKIRVFGHQHQQLEKILVAIHTAYITQRDGNTPNIVLSEWSTIFPEYVNLGKNERFFGYLWNNINFSNVHELYNNLCEITEKI